MPRSNGRNAGLKKYGGQNPKNGSKPTTQPSRRSSVGGKRARKPMRGCNDDHGINGCHRQPQNNNPKHAAYTGSVVDHHEGTNR